MRAAIALLMCCLCVLARGAQERGLELYEQIVAFEGAAQRAENQGLLDQAIDARRQAITLSESLGRPALLAVLFSRIGGNFEAGNQVQEAVYAYEAGFRALARDPGLNLGKELEKLTGMRKGYNPGSRAAPADMYSAQTERDLAAAQADRLLAVRLLIDMGNAYARQPQDGPALNAYRQALARPEIEHAPKLEAYALANSGELMRRAGDATGAERALAKALRLLDGASQSLERRRALALLAGIRRDRGDVAQARGLYEEALTLYARADDPRGEARALAGLARLQLDTGDARSASASFARARDLAERGNDGESLWYVYWGLGQSFARTGKLDEAATAFERSLSHIAARQRDLRTDEGKVTFLESAQDVFDQLVEVHLQRARDDPGRYADALAVAEEARGRSIADIMQGWGRDARPSESDLGLASCVAGADRMSPTPLREMSSLDVRQQAAGMPTQPAPDLLGGANTDPILDVRQQAVGVPAPRPFPNAAAPPRRESLPNAAAFPNAAAMPATEALPGAARSSDTAALRPVPAKPLARLVFHVMSERTAIFAVSPQGQVRGAISSLGRAQLAREVASLRAALAVDAGGRGLLQPAPAAASIVPDDSQAQASLRRLHEQLIAPLEDALPRNGELLVVEPHGPLWLLPFAALIDARGRPLVDRAALLYAPSSALLDEVRSTGVANKELTPRALIVGNPIAAAIPPADDDRFRVGFLPLPGADKEADSLATFFTDDTRTVLRGERADLASIVSQAPAYNIVHLATHGIARTDDPLESFVLLASSRCGDRLTARRVLSLPLRADLVTLSACQTGLGKVAGDGMIGLSRAFLIAGARAVLVSQWSIDDEATIGLMQAFYRSYLSHGMDKARALQRAMQILRANPRYALPRYWAAFALIGAER